MNPIIIRETVNQLLDKTQIKRLDSLIHFGNNKVIRYQTGLSNNGGLYAFWLKNTNGIAKKLNRTVAISTPNKKIEQVEWDWNLEDDQLLLYVGKSTNLRNRISMHLKLGTEKWDKNSDNTLRKKTTSCQVRAGIEHLIQNSRYNSFEFINQFIGISVVELPKFQDRFFAEDLAIGEGKPWFNIDSER
ncbi:MAG: GIY-YIG nuclease family protein [Bacteroidota bacterium]